MTQDEDFKKWWFNEGSQPPYTHHDCEEHTMRMCEIAWANGAYKAIAELESQEPVAWQFMNGSNFRKRRPDDFVDLDSDGLPYWKPLYTTPPQRTEPVDYEKLAALGWQAIKCGICGGGAMGYPQRTEQNFCSRCGKRTADLTTIHTCTPPQD
jgi:hypothetical protein